MARVYTLNGTELKTVETGSKGRLRNMTAGCDGEFATHWHYKVRRDYK